MRGSQIPRLQIEPDRVSTDGPDAAMLMEAYGNKLDPWQETVENCWMGKDENGEYTATSIGLSVPRQNGKNEILEGRELFGMLVNGERILHTAHQVKTAKKSFRRFVRIFEDERYPEIREQVEKISYTNGEESIQLKNGGSIEYSARSRQAARGFDGISVIVFDEAQELTDDQLNAIMATLAASKTGTRQILYVGTPPYPGCPGDVFRRRRNVCLNDPGKHDAWHEWSVEAQSVDDINMGDTSIWYSTNPALGIRLSEEFTQNEYKTMKPDGFARERLGWWVPMIEVEEPPVIKKEAWDKCASDQMKPDGKTAYGVKFSADGSEVVLSGAVMDKEGKIRISLIKREPTGSGLKWLADWLNQRYAKASCVVVDGRNGVDVLVERISDTWIFKGSVIRASTRDVLAAVGMTMDAIHEGNLTWYKLQEDLNDSAITSVKRPIAGGYGFGGENSLPIESCALALYGVKVSKRDPNQKMRIG